MRLCFNQSRILLKCQAPMTGSGQARAGGSEQARGTCHSLPKSCKVQDLVFPLVTFKNYNLKKYTALLAAGWFGLLSPELVGLCSGTCGLIEVKGGQGPDAGGPWGCGMQLGFFFSNSVPPPCPFPRFSEVLACGYTDSSSPCEVSLKCHSEPEKQQDFG